MKASKTGTKSAMQAEVERLTSENDELKRQIGALKRRVAETDKLRIMLRERGWIRLDEPADRRALHAALYNYASMLVLYKRLGLNTATIPLKELVTKSELVETGGGATKIVTGVDTKGDWAWIDPSLHDATYGTGQFAIVLRAFHESRGGNTVKVAQIESGSSSD
jgi:hypothetical protein